MPPTSTRFTTPVAEPSSSSQSLYVRPEGDAPLDAVEQALVRALVNVFLREIREEEAVAAADRLDNGTAP